MVCKQHFKIYNKEEEPEKRKRETPFFKKSETINAYAIKSICSKKLFMKLQLIMLGNVIHKYHCDILLKI